MAVYQDYIEAPAAGDDPPAGQGQPAPPKREVNPFLKYKGGNPFQQYAPGQAPYAGPNPEPGPTSTESAWAGMLHGAGNPLYGGIQLGHRAVGSTEMDRTVENREARHFGSQAVADHPNWTAAGQIAGEIMAGLPLALLTGGESVAGRAGMGVIQGVTGGVLAPTMTNDDPDSYWKQKAVQGAAGGVTGGALSGAGAVLSPPAGSGASPLAALWQRMTGGAPAAAPAPVMPAGAAPGGAMAPRPQAPPLGQPPLAGGMAQPAIPQPTPRPQMSVPPEPRNWTEAARMLQRGGVRLSPGQALGGSEMERSLQTWPILRGFVERKVGTSLDDFDRSVMQQALEPAGIIVPRSVRAGHDLIEFGTKQLGKAYDRVLPNLSLGREGLARVLQSDPALAQLASEMATDDAQRLARMVQNRVLGKFGGGDKIGGDVIKSIEEDLGKRAASLAGGRDQELSHALQVTLSAIRDELSRQNPEHAADLQKINQAFSMFARVRHAAGRDADSKGRFTPHDLLQALKGEDVSSGNSTFARGRAPMQAFAEAGHEIIGPSLHRPENYTRSAARVMTDAAAGAAAAPFYMGVGGMQRHAPGVGFGMRSSVPGVGIEAGRDVDREPRHSTGAE